MHTRARSALMVLGLVLGLFHTGWASIAGGYRVPDGTVTDRNYSSVAGEIEVGSQATVGKLDTVAGSIRVRDGSRVREVESVAGAIRLGAEVQVEGSVETVAGEIDIARGCTIGGGVETVAGKISIRDSLVKGDIVLRFGELDLSGTKVGGAVRIKHARDKDAEMPEITIGPNSEVTEVIVADDKAVHLRIHRSAKVGAVQGAQAEYYD